MNKILRKAVFTFAALALASCNVQAAGEELNYTVFNDGEISEDALYVLEYLRYPARVYPEGTEIADLIAEYEEFEQKGLEDGFTPVFVESSMEFDDFTEEYLEMLDEYLEMDLSAEDGKSILDKRYEEISAPDYYGSFLMNLSQEAFEESYADILNDDSEYEVLPFMSLCDWNDEGITTKEAILLMIPTLNPWEAVGYIPFGGYNDCPMPDEMMAICRYWYEKYQVRPGVIGYDCMEMIGAQLIAKEEAIEVAKEHLAFDYDAGYSEEDVYRNACCLTFDPNWFFWWD